MKFQAAGHPPIELVLKYGKDQLSMDQYLSRIFVTEDPRLQLRPAPPPPAKGRKGGKAPRPVEKAPEVEKLIETGTVEPGMTREQVLMAIGYPPAHRTPSGAAYGEETPRPPACHTRRSRRRRSSLRQVPARRP